MPPVTARPNFSIISIAAFRCCTAFAAYGPRATLRLDTSTRAEGHSNPAQSRATGLGPRFGPRARLRLATCVVGDGAGSCLHSCSLRLCVLLGSRPLFPPAALAFSLDSFAFWPLVAPLLRASLAQRTFQKVRCRYRIFRDFVRRKCSPLPFRSVSRARTPTEGEYGAERRAFRKLRA